MSQKIGHFDIVSLISQSAFATVYKATDTTTQQTVALKVVQLNAVKDRAPFVKTVFDEAEQAKRLNSHNIAALHGVGDEDDQLLAAAEYVQGNSIATTLARHEGFSIWDLQDIARQACHALDHAQVHKVAHQSLEPAKIMVQWDGQVKVLGFGISSMNPQAANASGVPEVMHYVSPEQLRGEACDHRSALFSLGAILYEMATEQLAFPGENVEQVRAAILEGTPPLPHRLRASVNSGLSALIMKALAKSPDERYQSGQELVRDLEQCKSGSSVIVSATPKAAPQKAQAQRKETPKAFAAAAGAIGSTAPAIGVTSTKVNASVAPEVEEKPSFAVDPLMAGEENAPANLSVSFSDVSELPPLREVRVAQPPPTEDQPSEVEPEPAPAVFVSKAEPEKPKVQVRDVAKKAVNQIRQTPPKLYMYAIGGAVALIGFIVAGITFYNYFEDRDSGSSSAAYQAQPAPAPAVKPVQAPAPQPSTEASAEQQAASEDSQETTSPVTDRKERRKSRPAPAVVPAQLIVSSSPEGAEISFDGSVLCQAPCTLTGIAPGSHLLSASKAGFSSANRMLSVQSGESASVSLQLAQLTAILTVSSTPAGAAIVIDGKDSGKLTPSQITLDKPGTHAVTVRRYGFLDANNSVNIELGQTSSLNFELTHLGNTDDIRAASGKFKKVFSRAELSGMGIVSVKTQPKGAQIMVNNRVLDKTAPFDFYLNPGTYVIDVTMSGYKPLHRVITIQEGEKLAIEESLIPE